MPKCLLAAALFSTLAVSASAQDAKPADPAPLQLTAQQDHKLMMEALKIESLRRGADGMNRNAPNAANYDESKANPYPNLPDPLTLKNGEKVTTPEQWWNKRRPEIVEDFDREVYGRVPKDVPKVTWEVTGTTEEKVGDVPAVTKRLVGHVDNAKCPQIKVDIQLTLTTPADAKGPVPVMMEFGFGFGPRPGGPRQGGHAEGRRPEGEGRPSGRLRGRRTVVAAAGPRQGLGLRHHRPEQHPGRQRRRADQGHHRPVQQGAGPQARRLGCPAGLGLGGQPRPGLLRDRQGRRRQAGRDRGALALRQGGARGDGLRPRFAIGFIGSSGEGGAKLHRRNFGELVENLTGSGEYHWMAGNFLKYGGPLTPGDLPVDAHELIALCAPRPTFISYGASTRPGAEGQWVDQRGSFMAAVAAGPVFRLLGKKDLGTSEFPEVETGITDGELAFRQHKGGHTTGPNWPTFLAFADRYIKVKNAPATSKR